MFNKIKVYLIHFFKFQIRGIKPTRYRENEVINNGYFIDLSSLQLKTGVQFKKAGEDTTW